MNERAIESTELNKILSLVSAYAVLGGSKSRLATLRPVSKLIEAQKRLQLTEECVALLFEKGVSQIEYFDNADFLSTFGGVCRFWRIKKDGAKDPKFAYENGWEAEYQEVDMVSGIEIVINNG